MKYQYTPQECTWPDCPVCRDWEHWENDKTDVDLAPAFLLAPVDAIHAEEENPYWSQYEEFAGSWGFDLGGEA